MAKFARIPKLSKEEREKLILEFCQALAVIKNVEEAAQFVKDLLGAQEIEMIAKRLKIAKLLLDGKTYEEIREELKVASGTISRVHIWLQMSGEGYRLIAKRTERRKPTEAELMVKDSLRSYVRGHSTYYWPYFLWKEIMKSLGQRRRERLQNVLAGGEDKKKIYEAFDELLQETYEKKKRKKFL